MGIPIAETLAFRGEALGEAVKKPFSIAMLMFGLVGCGTEGDEGEVSNVEQDVSRAARFAPSGSDLDFVGLYRLKNQATNECLRHDLSFGQCGTGQEETPDKVSVYRGIDGRYLVCSPVPPTLVAQKVCTNWELESGSPDFSFDFLQFELQGGNIQDGAATGDVVEVCSAEAQAMTFQLKCLGASVYASGDAYGDLTVNQVCDRGNNKRACVSSHVLSVKNPGQTRFYRSIGNIRADATTVPGEYLLRAAESDKPQYPWYRRDTGGFLSKGDNESANNYRWVPLYIPDPDAPEAKRIDSPTPAPKTASCSITATKTASRVDLNWSSANAVACLLTIDGKPQKAASKCTNKLSLFNIADGPSHVAKVFVAGATGTRSCTVRFTEP